MMDEINLVYYIFWVNVLFILLHRIHSIYFLNYFSWCLCLNLIYSIYLSIIKTTFKLIFVRFINLDNIVLFTLYIVFALFYDMHFSCYMRCSICQTTRRFVQSHSVHKLQIFTCVSLSVQMINGCGAELRPSASAFQFANMSSSASAAPSSARKSAPNETAASTPADSSAASRLLPTRLIPAAARNKATSLLKLLHKQRAAAPSTLNKTESAGRPNAAVSQTLATRGTQKVD